MQLFKAALSQSLTVCAEDVRVARNDTSTFSYGI